MFPTNVLVVENAPAADALTTVLHDEGIPAVSLSDGAAAFAWLANHPPPGLIILDIATADVSVAELRADARLTPVPVLAIGSDPAAPASEGALLLRRPFNAGDLLDAMERAVTAREPASAT